MKDLLYLKDDQIKDMDEIQKKYDLMKNKLIYNELNYNYNFQVSKIENIENFENPSTDEIVEITKQDLINASNEQIQVDDIDDTELVVNSVDGNSMVINSHGSNGTDKENDRPNSKVKRRIPKSKSSILTGQLNRDSNSLKPGTPKRFNRKENKRASFYQKLKGYNEIMDELITMRNEYELVQQEKIKLREKLAVEEEKQLLSEENHQSRVNGLLAEFKKVCFPRFINRHLLLTDGLPLHFHIRFLILLIF